MIELAEGGIECRSRLEFDTEFSATLCCWNKCETCRNNPPKECTRPPEIFGCAVRAGISRKPTPPRVPQRPSQYSAWRPLNRFTINHRGTRQPPLLPFCTSRLRVKGHRASGNGLLTISSK